MRPRKALSIRQPFAELILRGEKTIEYRSQRTNIIGERFYIYAACKPGPSEAWAELGCEMGDPLPPESLPTGVIVGSAIIARCVQNNGNHEWYLKDVKRLKQPRKPKNMPQPVWFKPF